MKYKNNLVLISGPAASGKTTLIKKLNNYYIAHYARPVDSYFELAKSRNIPVGEAFFRINGDDAEEHFINICKKYPLVIGDQHLAIQFNRDSQMAISNNCEISENIEEEYSEAVSKEFIEKIKQANINIILVLLKADSKELFERAKKRYAEIGHAVRNKNEEEVIREIEAETKFFEKLIEETKINKIVVDTKNKSEQDVYLDSLQKINSFLKRNQIKDDNKEYSR